MLADHRLFVLDLHIVKEGDELGGILRLLHGEIHIDPVNGLARCHIADTAFNVIPLLGHKALSGHLTRRAHHRPMLIQCIHSGKHRAVREMEVDHHSAGGILIVVGLDVEQAREYEIAEGSIAGHRYSQSLKKGDSGIGSLCLILFPVYCKTAVSRPGTRLSRVGLGRAEILLCRHARHRLGHFRRGHQNKIGKLGIGGVSGVFFDLQLIIQIGNGCRQSENLCFVSSRKDHVRLFVNDRPAFSVIGAIHRPVFRIPVRPVVGRGHRIRRHRIRPVHPEGHPEALCGKDGFGGFLPVKKILFAFCLRNLRRALHRAFHNRKRTVGVDFFR